MDTSPSRAAPLPRADVERRLCEAIARGWTLARLADEPGFPSRQTVWRWSRGSPRLAEALRDARGWRRGLRTEARAGPGFAPERAEALLAALRRGAALAELLRRPDFPNRRRLNLWKRERPDFARDLAAAALISRRLRGTRWQAYDEPAADRVICALAAGGRMGEVLAAPEAPGPVAVARWRKARPDFDHAVRMALLSGRRRRAAARRGAGGPGSVDPALAAKVCRRIARGATLDDLAGRRGLPHRATLHRWLRRDLGFAAQVRLARAARDEPLADELLAVAEAATPETLDAARRRIAEIKQALGQRGEKRRG